MIFKLCTIAYQTLSSEEPSYLCSQFLNHPSPASSVHLVFTCQFSALKLMLGFVFFQLLSLLFGIHSLNMLNHQIASILSVTIWKLTFSDSLILLRFPCHLIIVDELCIVPCTRCATEFDRFRGYWRYKSFVIIIMIKPANYRSIVGWTFLIWYFYFITLSVYLGIVVDPFFKFYIRNLYLSPHYKWRIYSLLNGYH